MKTKIHIQCYLIPSYKVVLSSLSSLFFKKAVLECGGPVGKYSPYGETCLVTITPEKRSC